jgi:hypothetical protein
MKQSKTLTPAKIRRWELEGAETTFRLTNAMQMHIAESLQWYLMDFRGSFLGHENLNEMFRTIFRQD